jgi:hypothetical protein
VNNFAPYGRALADMGSGGSKSSGVTVPSFKGGLTSPAQDEPASGDDFWSRLKAKMRTGQITGGTEEKN